MHRKDAEVAYFIEAINYEKELSQLKTIRKLKYKGQKKKFDFQDHAIKRRIIHLYDRSCRKFRQNLPLWKEYLHFLCKTRSLQKLNRVVSACLQLHPTVLDFWLVAVYIEFDMKGNIFSARNLML